MLAFWNRRGAVVSNEGQHTEATASEYHSFRDSNSRDKSVSETNDDLGFYLSHARRQRLLMEARSNRCLFVDSAKLPHSTDSIRTDMNAYGLKDAQGSFHSALQDIEMQIKEYIIRVREIKSLLDPSTSDILCSTTQDINYLSVQHEIQAMPNDLQECILNYTGTLHPETFEMQQTLFFAAFHELASFLKKPCASDIVHQMQCFTQTFQIFLKQNSQGGQYIHSFIESLAPQFELHSLYKDLPIICNVSQSNAHFLHDILETFLMEKSFTWAFTALSHLDAKDDNLYKRIQSLQFIKFCHFDLPDLISEDESAQETWNSLIKHLQNFISQISPRRKMDSLICVCRSLTQFLSEKLYISNGKSPKRFLAADEFLPAFIFLVLKSNVRGLKRAIEYIFEYRHSSQLISESRYFLTHLLGTVEFLETLDPSHLSISDEEFCKGLQRMQIPDSVVRCQAEIRFEKSRLDVLAVRARRLKGMERPKVCDMMDREK